MTFEVGENESGMEAEKIADMIGIRYLFIYISFHFSLSSRK